MKRVAKILAYALVGTSIAMAACSSVSGIDDLSFTAGACTKDADCAPIESECRVAKCIGGVCSVELVDNEEANEQIAGDCRATMCRNGKPVLEVDLTDVPATSTDCDENLCQNGEPSNPLKLTGTGCHTDNGLVCDGKGTCVECLRDSDCGLDPNPCAQYFCTHEGRCDLASKPEGTAILEQQPGDCRKWVCDGKGLVIPGYDDTDIADDGNDCTTDACDMGEPVHTAREAGAPCGHGLLCNGGGECVGCSNDVQCTPPSTCGGGGKFGTCGCTPIDCTGKTCGVWSNGCGGYTDSCDDGKQNGSEAGIDCGTANCGKCEQGSSCKSNGDCLSGFCIDDVCCNEVCSGTCRACSKALKGQGVDGICGPIKAGRDPDNECEPDADPCGHDGFCSSSGTCRRIENGTVCAPSACTSPTSGSMEHVAAGLCSYGQCIVAEPLPCEGLCDDEKGCLSCAGDADCPAGSFCGDGACKRKLVRSASCTRDFECRGGHCVDDVCCNSACTETCMGCTEPGERGTCVLVATGAADPHTCEGTQACGVGGACKSAQGQSCQKDEDCALGHCADGVCCDRACNGMCEACNLPGAEGTCTAVGAGKSDDTCPAPDQCQSTGLCRRPNGVECKSEKSFPCASGFCVDGVCCENACEGTCKACNVPAGPGYCAPVPTGNPDDTCGPEQGCDVGGQCKNVAGQPCTTGVECLSGNCQAQTCAP